MFASRSSRAFRYFVFGLCVFLALTAFGGLADLPVGVLYTIELLSAGCVVVFAAARLADRRPAAQCGRSPPVLL